MKFIICEGANGTRFVGEPEFGPIVAHISRMSGVGINSHARDEEAAGLLHELGLHTQQEVIDLHARGVPGYGPANPVDRTTHCRRNDGVAYPHVPVGGELLPWQRGIDTQNSPAFNAEARKLGYIVTLTYPGESGEAQHVNFHTYPHADENPYPVLHAGAKGEGVIHLTGALMTIHSPVTHKPYLSHHHVVYSDDVVRVVAQFQKDHHQHPDGVVAAHTWQQIRVSLAYWRAHAHA
jgi:hypothetical protein